MNHRTRTLRDPNWVAEVTGLSVNTLAWLRYDHRGPAWCKLGRRVFYDEQGVHDWIDAQFAAAQGGDAA